ncbi:hypothetical protein ABG067_004416 [Albugo candida]|uniref:Mis18 domain-containing protein n=1 Tax=Albugo candida TaxID=65357 RepID=A0A024GAR6_9STRA|nr:unnamed protein product [Albugo candida]|eukprot:CCI43941.1 unnamed protein product [Albugo candida]
MDRSKSAPKKRRITPTLSNDHTPININFTGFDRSEGRRYPMSDSKVKVRRTLTAKSPTKKRQKAQALEYHHAIKSSSSTSTSIAESHPDHQAFAGMNEGSGRESRQLDFSENEIENKSAELDARKSNDERSFPVIFQCNKCRSILGDSFSFVCSSKKLSTLTLDAVTNVVIKEYTKTSQQGIDIGSSFRDVFCRKCKMLIGQYYLTTPRELDDIRNCYSLFTKSIASYQLGHPHRMRSQRRQDQDENDVRSMSSFAETTSNCVMEVEALSHDRAKVSKLYDDMSKVQNLLLVLDERLHAVEKQEEQKYDAVDEIESESEA